MYYNPVDITNLFSLRGKSGNPPRLLGENLMACCPKKHRKPDGSYQFERNPSFGINLRTGKFGCFSCGFKGLSIKDLAYYLNVELPALFRTYVPDKPLTEEQEIDEYYMQLVSRNTHVAETYLASRGIFGVAGRYNIGASSDGRKIYFPIQTHSGRFVAWMERTTDPKEWRLLPENVNRSSVLYGIHEKFSYAEGCLVESTMDKLRLSSWGYNALATCSATTVDEQLEAVLDAFDEIVIVPQNDAAGLKWAKRCAEYFLHRARVFILRVPKNYKDVADMQSKDEFDLLYKKKIFVTG